MPRRRPRDRPDDDAKELVGRKAAQLARILTPGRVITEQHERPGGNSRSRRVCRRAAPFGDGISWQGSDSLDYPLAAVHRPVPYGKAVSVPAGLFGDHHLADPEPVG